MNTTQQQNQYGETLWLTGHTPQPITGPCVHNCPHTNTTHIAYGPDERHYTLNQCRGCGCRAWFNDEAKHRTRWLAHD